MNYASPVGRGLVAISCFLGACITPGTASAAASMKVFLPLERVAYQTNELIDVSIVRSSHQALPTDDLSLTLNGDDGSKLAFTFALPEVAVEGKDARRTDHLHIDGRLLRPGGYSIEARAGGLEASSHIEVYSHLRRSDFKLIDWGSSARGKEQAVLGGDSMGFNLLYVTQLSKDDSIRGGCDFMQNCTMGGAHQIDLHMENDWSDPYVLQGGEARVVRQALKDRSMPNCTGVHLYDEPGLTWWKDPHTGVMVPFNIPAQDRSYRSAFDAQAPQYGQVKPDDAAAVARWDQLNRWKLSFMEAAWKDAQFGVSRVQQNLLSVTQSEYAWYAYADGYYFNVVRPLPAISGHGGYDDGPAGYLYPSFHHELGRMRDLNKPEWYLPTWYGIGTDNWRLEQYLSFMTGLQGMAKPPDYHVQDPNSTKAADGIVETNKLFARLGTIFTKTLVTRPPVAQLYSISQDLGAEVRDMLDPSAINIAAYEGGHHNRAKSLQTYLAGKAIHVSLFPIVEEDILDGTLAAHHKAVVLPGIDTLDPKVIAALEAYIAGGGVVLVSDDSKVRIKGATKLGAAVDVSQYDLVNKLWTTDQKESMKQRAARLFLRSAEPLAKALKEKLKAIGITPDLDADSPQIVTSRQSAGDIDYLFAVNATGDESGGILDIKSADATLTIPADQRPIYDAVHGGEWGEGIVGPQRPLLPGKYRFGPGQMRVWARAARPIGGVQVQPPVLFSDYTVASEPLHIEAQAVLMDNFGQVLAGVAPMQVRLIDPLGQVRYDLYRACDRGVLRIDLPLAANDPAGEWRLSVRELLNDTEGHATFSYKPAAQCGAAAGATRRAVYFGNFADNDRDHVFRFFRQFHDVTIVKGSKDYESAAAERIVAVLKPWDVRCKVMDAKDAAKPRELTLEESAAWAGLEGSLGPKATEKPGPNTVGFAVRGPVILVGTPDDNPLIKFELEQHFLTYNPDADFPGRGRGYLSWQRDAVSYGNDSVTLIAYDAAGMSEAVGSMYEAAAGLDPLTRYELPSNAAVTLASRATAPPRATVAWRAVVPDRVTVLQIAADGVSVYTADGSVTKLDDQGGVMGREDSPVKSAPAPAKAAAAPAGALLPSHIVKRVAAGGGMTAIAYWGGAVQIVAADGTTRSVSRLRGDVSDIAWFGGTLVVGTSDGEVMGIKP